MKPRARRNLFFQKKRKKRRKINQNKISPGSQPSIQSTNDAPMIHSETVSTEWSSAATATGGQIKQKKSLPQKNIDLALARRTARTAPATAMDDIFGVVFLCAQRSGTGKRLF